MNILRNFEAVFLIAAAVGLAASYATASARPVEMVVSPAPQITADNLLVVVISAPRLPAQ